ncbi:FecR family protein [Cyclobacterium roseum]|uniref:FecR family protein n=1 Tax=Cyclobacterium roseum TaxID=2666137 RepID=UPI001390BB68|nr:FecR domain-containing protein [Cyclobacterium roseum]
MQKQDDIFLFLLTNPEFVRWVKKPSPELETYWKNWMLAHPESLGAVKRAREMVAGLRQPSFRPDADAKSRVLQTILVSETISDQQFSEKSIDRTKTFFWFALDQWTKVAAILFLTLFSTVFFNKMTISPSAQEEEVIPVPELVTKVTQFGEKLNIKLPDGSSVWLNSGSELEFPEKFDSLERRVILRGEGFFEVIPDRHRPFRVETGKIVTEALGTSFAINDIVEDKLEISLVSGKVKINHTSTRETVLLNPGEQLRYRNSNQSMEVGSFSVDKILGWKDGVLQFSNAGFEEVINSLERWYGVQITFSGRPDNSWRLSGRYTNQNLDLVLNRMAYIESFDYRIKGKNVHLKF